MALEPILKVTAKSVTKRLKASDVLAVKRLGEYLEQIRIVYDVMMDHYDHLSFEEKLSKLDTTLALFSAHETNQCEFVGQLKRTIASLRALNKLTEEKYGYTIDRFLVLSTLIVENFFSQVFSYQQIN